MQLPTLESIHARARHLSDVGNAKQVVLAGPASQELLKRAEIAINAALASSEAAYVKAVVDAELGLRATPPEPRLSVVAIALKAGGARGTPSFAVVVEELARRIAAALREVENLKVDSEPTSSSLHISFDVPLTAPPRKPLAKPGEG